MEELLISINKKDLSEQKNILDKTLENWTGNLEQVDDILVIEIRIK